MKCYLFFTVIFIIMSCAKTQEVTIVTDKKVYDINDSIQIMVTDNLPSDVIYAIGIEIRESDSWKEIEPDINGIGKTKIFKKLGKNCTFYNVELPKYFGYIAQKNNNQITIRFSLQEGININNLTTINTDPVLIRLKQ